METLKQFMAFPLFATVLWLLWVLSAQRGSAGVLVVLSAMLLVAFATWIAERLAEAPVAWRRGAAGTAAVLALVVVIWLLPGQARSGAASASDEEPGWIAWSPGVVDRLRAEGRPVYVDFTARWCLTCQVNKAVVFGSREVRRTFAERDVALVRADWTSQDPRITEALAAYGRSGVPLNVYYPPEPGAEPLVLPTVLSPGIVLGALDAS
jgi:thiol:disulfide interchange protein DsbD